MSPCLSTSRRSELTILVPWIVSGFFKLITPFIDPLTKEKLKFNDDMRKLVPPQQLWTEFQGDLEFEYDHATYWPALLSLCKEKHAAQRERWVKAGKHYGESEIYMKGGDAHSIFGQEYAPEKSEKVEETVEPTPEATSDTKAPAQTSGTQSNGNMDTIAVKADPDLTTEGDRA